MDVKTLTIVALSVYVLATLVLTVRGAMQTSSVKSFALGAGAIHPGWIGLSLTAQLTSVATFVVNPGLVYAFGVSALMGLGVAAGLGITIGLLAFSGKFRQVGSRIAALSIPQWIGTCYQSNFLRVFFAIISLCLATFIVLIAVAICNVLANLLGIVEPTGKYALLGAVVVFVFTYTLAGGAATSTYTNAIQATIMLIVALILIGSGIELINGKPDLFTRLSDMDPKLLEWTNPMSPYFRTWFEVFFCNFLVGLAIVCQPHILGKALLIREESQMKTYLGVAVMAGSVFLGVMLVGLYAKVTLPPMARIDLVVPAYITQVFSSWTQVIIGIGMLCAGISTLEGILLALSVIFSNDIFPFLVKRQEGEPEEDYSRKALMFGRTCLVFVGLISIWMAIEQMRNPTGGSVAIFAQYGVYLLFTASFLPLACGMFLPQVKRMAVTAGTVAAVIGYAAPHFLKISMYNNNPAFLATCGILLSWIVMIVIHNLSPGQNNAEHAG